MDEEAEIPERRLLFGIVPRGACYWVVELWPDGFHRPLALFDTEKAATRYLQAIYGPIPGVIKRRQHRPG